MHLDDTILPLLEKRHYIVENSPKCATGAGLANLERTFGPDGRAGGPVSRPTRAFTTGTGRHAPSDASIYDHPLEVT
jgi:hypothetical protein